MRRVRWGWLALAVFYGGCGGSPVAPNSNRASEAKTSVVPATAVLIQTFYYAEQTKPFAGVAVRVNGSPAGATDIDGTLVVDVPVGGDTTIEVTHTGYRSASASGAVAGPGEHWTFWLMRDQQ